MSKTEQLRKRIAALQAKLQEAEAEEAFSGKRAEVAVKITDAAKEILANKNVDPASIAGAIIEVSPVITAISQAALEIVESEGIDPTTFGANGRFWLQVKHGELGFTVDLLTKRPGRGRKPGSRNGNGNSRVAMSDIPDLGAPDVYILPDGSEVNTAAAVCRTFGLDYTGESPSRILAKFASNSANTESASKVICRWNNGQEMFLHEAVALAVANKSK